MKKYLPNVILDAHNLLPITARVILKEAAATRDNEARIVDVDRAIGIVQTKWPQYFRADAKQSYDLFQQQ